VGPAAFDWLSRGAAEAIRDFIARATGPGWGLRVGAYEFTDEHVLGALKDAWAKRKADVKILYHAVNDAQKTKNEAAIKTFGLGAVCDKRKAKGLKLSHNKIIVLTKGGVAQAVLTGSTNFSEGGIYGHSNEVHISEDNRIAAQYLRLWNELKKNEDKNVIAPILEGRTPLPPDPPKPGTMALFSPRPDLKALEWYAKRAKEANDALFMTFAFGNERPVPGRVPQRQGAATLRADGEDERADQDRGAAQGQRSEDHRAAQDGAEQVRHRAYLSKGAFDRWLAERLTGLNVNVRYLHTKYMLVDPLGTSPLVVSGSANFSEASTQDNDENMLIIRGEPRVADIYIGEFMRLYRHFAFRDWLSQHPKADEAQVSHLDETDTWWKAYFGTSFASRQREYFAG